MKPKGWVVLSGSITRTLTVGENEAVLVVAVPSNKEVQDITMMSNEDSPLFGEEGQLLFNPFQQDGKVVRVTVRLKDR